MTQFQAKAQVSRYVLVVNHPRMRGVIELRSTSAYGASVEVTAAFGSCPTLTLDLHEVIDGGGTRFVKRLSSRAEVA